MNRLFSTFALMWPLCIAGSSMACRPRPPATQPGGEGANPASEIPLLDPSTVPGDFMLRQHIEGEYGERRVAFEAIVQKQGNTLLVLTLTPYGSRAFAITQTGQDVTVEKFISRDLPFDPRFILLDVQRVFLMGLPDAPLEDGWHRARARGELIRERWEGGKLFERRYRRRDRNTKGEILVDYAGGYTPGERPPAITLKNEPFGYALRLETSDYQPL